MPLVSSDAPFSPLGVGKRHPNGSLADTELQAQLMRYRRSVASAYTSVQLSQISTYFTTGPFHITEKVDGELWFLILEDGEVALASPKGAVIQGDIPVLQEARDSKPQMAGRTVIAGELFAMPVEGAGRPRVSGLASALGGEKNAPTDALGFIAFDFVIAPPEISHDEKMDNAFGRSEVLSSLIGKSDRLKSAPFINGDNPLVIEETFRDWVEGRKAEGLVVRDRGGRVFKIKPEFTVDAMVVGFTVRREANNQVRSLALALIQDDGSCQLIGGCGNLGSDKNRVDLFNRLQPIETKSEFRKASYDGAVYRFVKPEVVVELNASDVQSQDASGKAIRQLAMSYDDSRWVSRGLKGGASLIHPVLSRVRDDKSVSKEELRFAQLTERCFILNTGAEEDAEVKKSELLRRDVYVKETKGKKSVRKLLVWKTNKGNADYPDYVICYIDYAPDRKEPIKRIVKPAPSEEFAQNIADNLIEQNIKKGWSAVTQ